jgi:AcrR family transcriptional regulator
MRRRLLSSSSETPVGQPSLAARLATNGILYAAIEVFSRQGFDATRVEDILQAANVARRTFYKHFSNKEDVLAAIYELATTELLRAIRGDGAVGGDPFDGVERALDAYLDYHVANARLVRVLVEQAIRSESALYAHRQRFRRDLIALLDMAVRMKSGEENDPFLYTALVSALEGLSLELLSSEAGPREVHRAKAVMHALLERTLNTNRGTRPKADVKRQGPSR